MDTISNKMPTEEQQPEYLPYNPPDDIFLYKEKSNPKNRALTEGSMPILEKIDFSQYYGIFTYLKGFKYPKPGIVSPDIIINVNLAKRQAMGFFGIFRSKYIWAPLLGILILPWRAKIDLASSFMNGLANTMSQSLHGVLLERRRYQTMIRELMNFLENFLIRLGFKKELAERISLYICTIIEYDDQYHLRIYDLFEESSKEAFMRDPGKEINRLMLLSAERGKGTAQKFEAVGKMLIYILKVPKVKRAFLDAFEEVWYPNLQVTEAAAYYTLNRTDYNYGGLSNEERWEYWEKAHTDKVTGKINLPPAVRFTINN